MMFKTENGFIEEIRNPAMALEKAMEQGEMLELAISGLRHHCEDLHPSELQFEVLEDAAMQINVLIKYVIECRKAEKAAA